MEFKLFIDVGVEYCGNIFGKMGIWGLDNENFESGFLDGDKYFYDTWF